MKIKNLLIPTVLLTFLVVGTCEYFCNLDLLSMQDVCVISIISFIAFLILFLGVYTCVYEASRCVAEQQDKLVDRQVRFLAKCIDESFAASNRLTEDIVTQQSVKIVEVLKEASLLLNEGDDKRAKVLSELLVDIKQLSITSRDNSLVTKNASLNYEHLANEAIERLDNVLICLRGKDVEEKNIKVEE